jgi:hypothetical protein
MAYRAPIIRRALVRGLVAGMIALLLAPVCASAGAAMGMPALIRQLASDDALLRQDAVDQLMCLRRADLPALREAAVAQCPLLPAQVTGLHQVVTQVFLAGERFRIDPTEGEYPRGFLGIRFSTNPADRLQRTDGVMIADRIRGFPAFRQLRSGDVIMKIIDWPAVQLHSSDDFVRAVTMLAAGDEIHLGVMRFGRLINVSLKLDFRPEAVAQASAENIESAVDSWIDARDRRAESYWKHEFSAIDPSIAPDDSQASTSAEQ